MPEFVHTRLLMAKNITEKTIGFASGNKGCIEISNVVAPVLGIDIKGPIQASITHPTIVENFSPTLERTPIPFVSYLHDTTTASMQSTTSPTKKPANAVYHSCPANTPRCGGNIKLPAPKNVANTAKPIIMISKFFLDIISPSLSFPFYQSIHFCAASLSSSRNLGCAIAIRFSTLSLTFLPFSAAIPYSVTI